MRWSDLPAILPFQNLSALTGRALDPSAVSLLVTGDGSESDRAVHLLVPQDVRAVVYEHLSRSSDEQGGLLVGEVFTQDGRAVAEAARAVLLTRAIPALDFEGSGYALRMEAGVWERARGSLTAHDLIVGWYHSHPDLGAFFSSTDRRTQAAFFPHAYSVGWVMDPVRREEAFFIGPDSDPLVPPESAAA
jgi:proteasome lid subunit RPN8/RPN11